MPDALLGNEPMVAEWDGDAGLYLVRAWVAGPAGTAGLRLGGDIELDIDVAWPSRVAELRIPSPDGRLHDRVGPVVERLLGRRRLWRLVSGRRAEPWSLGGDPLYERSDGGVARGLRRAALARQIGNDPRHSPLRRGVALLEAASWAQRRTNGLGLRRARVHDARLGVELLRTALDRGPLDLDDAAGREFVTVLLRTADMLQDDPSTANWLRARAAEVTSHTHPSYEVRPAAAAMAMPAAAPVMARQPTPRLRVAARPLPQVRVDRRTLPVVFERSVVEARAMSAGEVEVRVCDERERAAGCWARAFDGTGTLLALAPLRATGPHADALLLVAPATVPDLVVDVIDQPGIRRPSAVLDAVESAIDAGRDAAGHERAGRAKDAAVAWGRTAERWQVAGDVTRAETARSYASGQVRGSRGGARIPPPLVADRVGGPIAGGVGRT